MSAPSPTLWKWRAAGLAVVIAFCWLTSRFWHPVYGFTAFLQLDASNEETKIDAFKRLPIFLYRNTGGYDGLYYAQIAYDPSLRSPDLLHATDNLVYRARRILPPALAYVVAAGDPNRIVYVYAALNIAVWLVLAAIVWSLFNVSDLRSWFGWFGVVASAGALHCVRLSLTDLLAVTLLAGALLAQLRNRPVLSTTLLALAPLSRETSLLALGAFFPERASRPWSRFLGLVFVSVLPLTLWLLYIRFTVGTAPEGWANFSFPVAAAVTKFWISLKGVASSPDSWLFWTTLLATISVFTQVGYVAIKRDTRNVWWRLAAPFAILACVLGTAVWEGHPGAITRVVLPLHLAVNALLLQRRATDWLAVANLGFFAGILALSHPVHDNQELAALHSRGTSLIAKSASGFYEVERSGRQTRTWTSGPAKIDLLRWGASTLKCTLSFEARSPVQRELRIVQSGRTLWSGRIGNEKQTVRIENIELAEPSNELEFQTATPTAPTPGDHRALAFALYNCRMQITAP